MPRRKSPLAKGVTKRPKYNNVKCEEDGIKFDSQMELTVYHSLKERKARGEIADFARPAPRLYLDVGEHRLSWYTPDFIVMPLSTTGSDKPILIEVKGRVNPDFPLRWKLAKALYSTEYDFEYIGKKEPIMRRAPKVETKRERNTHG